MLLELSPVYLVGTVSVFDGPAEWLDDGLIHRSFDSDGIVAAGEYTRFVPCRHAWLYARAQFAPASGPPNCIYCVLFSPKVF